MKWWKQSKVFFKKEIVDLEVIAWESNSITGKVVIEETSVKERL